MKNLLAVLLLFSVSAHAVDGVIEINQLCATTLGCFDGDTAGFPVTITSTGSYRLTSNLDVTALTDPEDVTAISLSVNALNTTIDLNGFRINGPVFCTASPVTSCTPSGGTGHGIDVSLTNINSVTTIKNGVIRGMGMNGINSEGIAAISNVHVINSGAAGIVAVSRSHLTNVYALRNGAEGIIGGVFIANAVVDGNATTGITPLTDGRVTYSRVTRSGDDGVDCGSCSLIENIITNNEGFGVNYSGRAVAGGNQIDNNSMGEITGAVPFEVAPNLCGNAAC